VVLVGAVGSAAWFAADARWVETFILLLLGCAPLRALLLSETIRLGAERLEWTRRVGPLASRHYVATRAIASVFAEIDRSAVTVELSNQAKYRLAASWLFRGHHALAESLTAHLRILATTPRVVPPELRRASDPGQSHDRDQVEG
jgi:hypothetical protein